MGYISELRELIGTRPIIMVGANVIVVDSENRLLLQLRADNNCWGLPGGSMEPGESLQEVAKRELYEECNLVANQLTFLNIFSGEQYYYQYPHGDEVFNVIATFVCEDYEGELQEDQNEVLSLQFFSIDDLPSNLNPPEFPIIQEYIHKRGMKIENYSLG
ncbi:NUDIX hydrolase [Sporosarcina sp. ACRSL]|uniref:NUDIX hydrolase n=1 Tax=Sporosarcina sp. ACRSL TaxID=2918215 RepID=UPI001EF653F6|nr:NUDIX hydrolase [Sporosarcina sp. ACRSL]MCG7342637.1 NUDIX hydrolase [Sporosarcina sp. ACRSL]